MAHFTCYDTDITSSGSGTGDQNNGPSPYPTPVKKGAELTLQPTQADFAEFITGSAETEKDGTLFIEQSFDYPRNHENEEVALEDSHWVPVETNKEGEQLKEGIKVKAGKPISFVVFATAPYFRLRWVQGTEDTKVLRIFARAQEKGRV